MNDDYDTPWKDALTRYFDEFVAFYFPLAHREIDWSVPCVFLAQNVFALVTAAHLLTQQTKGDHVKRHALKWFLARELYSRNWDKQRIVDMFNIIDWMMQIPPLLQARLMRNVAKLERNKGMAYMSSFERVGLERGLKRGLKLGRREALCELVGKLLTKRFGALPTAVQDRLNHATPAQLEAWGESVVDAPTLESVFTQRQGV